MAIKEPLMFITVEEFKNSKYFNELLFDKVTTPDNEIWFAISVASSNIDYLSGFTISKKWPEINPTDFTDNIQTATTNYVRFLLTKDVDYLRGQGSISQGGLTYSETNPDDPYFIPPEVFNYLRNIKEYIAFKGFDIDVSSKNNYYQTYFGNGGHNNLLELYLVITNLFSSDPRVKIKQIHKQNIQGTLVDIDTSAIKSIDNLKTNELFTKYFSNDSMQLVDGKQGQQSKVISISDEVGKLIESKQSQLTSDNAGDNITITGSGKNIKINSTGGKIDLSDYYKKEEIDRKIDDEFTYFDEKKQDIEDTNLQTESKQIVPAINELVTRLNNIPQWKEVAVTTDLLTINYVLKDKTHYRIYLNKYIKNVTEIGTNAFVVLYFYYQIDDKPFPISNLEYSNNILRIKQGKLWKLEELQDNSPNYEIISNTLQIISPSNIECNKPLIIKSNTLNTNNPIENTWQIDLKHNSQWKDVAFADDKGYQINYELKNNTYYRIFYDNSIMVSSLTGKYPCLIKEFYWIMTPETNYTDLWINIPCMGIGAKFENSLLIINKKRIYWQIKKQCDIWKLQELQE